MKSWPRVHCMRKESQKWKLAVNPARSSSWCSQHSTAQSADPGGPKPSKNPREKTKTTQKTTQTFNQFNFRPGSGFWKFISHLRPRVWWSPRKYPTAVATTALYSKLKVKILTKCPVQLPCLNSCWGQTPLTFPLFSPTQLCPKDTSPTSTPPTQVPTIPFPFPYWWRWKGKARHWFPWSFTQFIITKFPVRGMWASSCWTPPEELRVIHHLHRF